MKQKSPAIYSALGRITRLLVFDTTQYTISEYERDPETLKVLEVNGKPLLKTRQGMFQEIWDKYRFFVYDMNAYHEMEICICFQANPDGYVPEPWLDPHTLVHYVPVNRKDPQCAVPGNWTQDYIHITPTKVLCTHPEMLHSLVDTLREDVFNTEAFTDYTVEMGEPMLQGGNILRGKEKDKDFLVVGNPAYLADKSDKELEILLNDGEDIEIMHLFDAEALKNYPYIFFHLDLYCTLVGNEKGFSTHTIMVADANGKKEQEVDAGVWKLKNILKKGKLSKSVNFWYSNVPLLMLHNTEDEAVLGLCYNNSIVENYFSEGRWHRCIYLPDYRKELHATVAGLKKIENGAMKNKEVLQAAVEVFKDNLVKVNDQLNLLEPGIVPESLQKEIENGISKLNDSGGMGTFNSYQADQVVEKVEAIQHYLRLHLYRKKFDCVRFVRLPFYNDIFRLGALHCRVKVIERDCLP